MEDLQNLVPFVNAVRCGSFVAAAVRLQVTPPAISKSIARLERELGVRLFNRSTRRLDLTAEGRAFFERVSQLLAGVDEAVADLAAAAREPQGLVRASVTATFGRHCVMPIMRDFFARYPRVELELSFDETPPSLVEGGLDVRIRHGRSRETSQVSRELCDYPIALVASPEYLQRQGAPRTPAELAEHDCIGVRRPFGKAAWQLARIPTRAPRDAAKDEDEFIHNPHGPLTVATQLDASLTACLFGVGIAPCSVPVILPHLAAGRLKVVLPDYRIRPDKGTPTQVFIQFPHREYLPAKVRVFVDFLLERFRGLDYRSMDLAEYAA
jgi:DNA-binding transcriptional LysR family regulator